MSQAFIREGDEQSLSDIPPTVNALINFLIRENNGVRVYEKKLIDVDGTFVHEMSNGLRYGKDGAGRWIVVEM